MLYSSFKNINYMFLQVYFLRNLRQYVYPKCLKLLEIHNCALNSLNSLMALPEICRWFFWAKTIHRKFERKLTGNELIFPDNRTYMSLVNARMLSSFEIS